MQTVKRKRIKTENAIDNLKASFYKKNSNKNGNNGEEENGSYKFPVFLFASGVSWMSAVHNHWFRIAPLKY